MYYSFVSDFRRGLTYSPSERDMISSAKATAAARLAASQQADKALEDLIKYQSSALAPIRTVPPEIFTLIFFLAINAVVVPYAEKESPWNIAGMDSAFQSAQDLERHQSADREISIYSDPIVKSSHRIARYEHPSLVLPSLPGKLVKLAPFLRAAVRGKTQMGRLVGHSNLTQGLPTSNQTDPLVGVAFPHVEAAYMDDNVRGLMRNKIYFHFPALQVLQLELEYWPDPDDLQVHQYLCTLISRYITLRHLVWYGDAAELFFRFAVSAKDSVREHQSLNEVSIRTGDAMPSKREMTGVPQEVVLERIHTFEVENPEPWVMHLYLSHLSLPSLTNLTVWYRPDSRKTVLGGSEGQELADAVKMLVQRSGCQETLRSLCFRNLHPDVDLSPLFDATPNLVDLTLTSLWRGAPEWQGLLLKLRKITVDASTKERMVMPDVLVEILALRNPGRRVFSFKSFRKTWAFVKED
ncbi:hypothetical protein BKA70DRAFT_1417210 [Coprinopsis sp. MPI-PUGE-AT-0042]|nr:hypothetical protein BKA70DRAFT_1417210 [Coprinopsis sp. MPI-PUGE-AT-0042]